VASQIVERDDVAWPRRRDGTLLESPEVEGDKAKKQKFATYPIGYFHIDIAEVQTEDGKLDMFVAVDRTSKFAYAELHPRATRIIAKDFLDNLTKAAPSKIHT
jgi:hypothetical protein